MIVNLTVHRQQRCAGTPEGHRFDEHGKCGRCGLTVHPRLRVVQKPNS